MQLNNASHKAASLCDEIVASYGKEVLDLVITVYVNFYYSELEIIDLCAKWIPRRNDITEKSYLIKHASDEVIHADLFKEGIEKLGIDWDSLDHEKYRIKDISDRFDKLFDSDDQLEVLMGLNMYAEGVLALEEIHQLAVHKPQYFANFERIYKDELTHMAFGSKVLKRLIAESEENRRRAQAHCDWYQSHLIEYLDGELTEKIQKAIECGFVGSDYIPKTKERFRNVMTSLELDVAV